MRKLILLFSIFSSLLCACIPIQEKQLYSESFSGKKTWTIIVYMNGDNSLDSYTVPDINEMEKVNLGNEINVIVLVDRQGAGARLYKIQYDSNHSSVVTSLRLSTSAGDFPLTSLVFSPTVEPEPNMLIDKTLKDFIDYCKKYYPADYYGLIMWGHGDGWRYLNAGKAVEQDDNDGSGSPANPEFFGNNVIAQVVSMKNINVLGFDACFQASMETLWAMRQSASNLSYLVASPDTIPGYGWNYTLFLTYFRDSYRRPFDFGIQAVKAYKDTYFKITGTSLSAFDLTQLDISSIAAGSFKDFFTWINTNNKTAEKSLLNNSIQYGSHFRDLYDYALKTSYPYKNMILSHLEQIIFAGWKQEYGDGKYLSISYDDHGDPTLYNDPMAVPLSSTDWNEFIQ